MERKELMRALSDLAADGNGAAASWWVQLMHHPDDTVEVIQAMRETIEESIDTLTGLAALLNEVTPTPEP